MEDEKIVGMYFEKNEEAIRQTAAKYGAYLHKVAYRITNDLSDAEECVNDTYGSAWDSIPPNRPQNLRTYLAKLARSAAIDLVRRKNADKRGGGETALALDELRECIASGGDAQKTVEAKELGETVNAFLRGIDKNSRRIFILRYFYLESVSDIAKEYGYSQSKVTSMLSRTRTKLKKRLAKEGY